MGNIEKVRGWIERDLFRWRGRDGVRETKRAGGIRFEFFTATHGYSVYVTDDNYLGCTAHARLQRAGEDWHRGNDLPDGPCDEDTWRKIVSDIVAYEMVPIEQTVVRDLPDEANGN